MSREQQLLQKEMPHLRRFAYSLTADINDADDLVQDVVLKVLDRGLPEKVKPQAWLITLTKNLWIDQVRQREIRERPQTQDRIAEGSGEVRDPADINEDRQILDSLEQLPQELRVLFSLVVLEGYAYREAAEMLGIPVGTVMSRISRARKVLDEHLRTLQEPSDDTP